jgi:RNA polymerase sigma-70 factor, ECF subfamily
VDELSRLLVAARAGRVESFASFMRATQVEIWRFCAGVVGPDDVDDVTQEVFIEAWRSVRSFRGESSARTWLFVIARRTLQREVHRQRRRQAVPAIYAREHVTPVEGGLDVSAMLGMLDEDRRMAFVLTQFIGFSYVEVAAICNCAVGTIRSRVARARSDLVALRAAQESQRPSREAGA